MEFRPESVKELTEANGGVSALADKIGISRQSLIDWASGLVDPSFNNVCKLAVACGIDDINFFIR